MTTVHGSARSRQAWAGWLLTYLPFAMLFATLAPLLWPQDGVGDTFRFWFAGHIAATGGSPYDQNAWASAGSLYGGLAENVSSTCMPTPFEPACIWAYPPITALVFAPFGLLGVREGLNAVAAFALISGVAGVVAVGGWMRAASPWTRTVALCSCLVSEPFVFDVHAGHFEGIGLLGIVAIALGLTTRRASPVALGALLLSLKPHLYLGLAVVVLVLLIARRDWRTVGWTFAAVAVPNGVALLRYPEALGGFVGRAGSVIGLGWATTWSFAADVFPDLPTAGFAIVYGGMLCAFVAAIRFAPAERRTDVSIVAGSATALTISPYVQPYDLLVLFPAFALSMTLAERSRHRGRVALLALIAGTLAAGTWLTIAGKDIVVGLPGIMPVVALAVLGVAAWSARVGSAFRASDAAAPRARAIDASAPGISGSQRR